MHLSINENELYGLFWLVSIYQGFFIAAPITHNKTEYLLLSIVLIFHRKKIKCLFMCGFTHIHFDNIDVKTDKGE